MPLWFPRVMTLSRILAILAALWLSVAAPANAAAPARKFAVAKEFVPLDPFTVSVVENYKVRGLLVLEVTLQMTDSRDADAVDKLLPRLRDTLVRSLMEYGAKVAMVTRPPDLGGIARRLEVEVNHLLGAGKAKVLITQALVRPLG